ncbi:MAG: protein TolR [Rickettsiaceae bacterium]|nr:protein TolR [Rickettsiaceae bacterium]
MAMLQQQSKGKKRLISEINVTPLVDVMLVLLIIFMITSPMLVAGINVDLPQTSSNPIAGQDEPLTITVDKNGVVYIVETQVDRRELATKLIAITGEKKDTRIFVRGDKNASYGEIIDVVSEINAAGFTKVALITEIKYNEKR